MIDSDNLILEAFDLTKSFQQAEKKLEVLDRINFQVFAGDFLAITGASGVGKTTLLHILGGLDTPSSGKIVVENKDLSTLNELQLSQYRNKEVGFVFQFHYLLDGFSALENVMTPLLIKGESWNKSQETAVKILEIVGLQDRCSHQPGQLSGGERQRVALARAIVGGPKILIADEPTGDLDTDTAESLHDLFTKLNKERKMTIIVATHDLSLADRAKRKFQMSNGVLLEMSK